jgi:hypothetical protein
MKKYSKELSSVASSMLSILIMAQTGVSAAKPAKDELVSSMSTAIDSEKEPQESFLSKHSGKLLVGATVLTAAVACLFIPRQGQQSSSSSSNLSKEQLMAQLPDAWREFWAARAAAWAAAGDATKDAGGIAEWNAAWGTAWRKNGATYEIVKNNNREYFENLLKVLRAQTERLRAAAGA